MECVVLFGAGASFGSSHTEPDRPPLGYELYPVLKRWFPNSWGKLPREIDSVFTRNFEEGMQMVWERYSTIIPELMRHMTLFFAQFRPDETGRNLYIRFIDLLKAQGIIAKVCLCTLNYDMLLEEAIRYNGQSVEYMLEDIKSNNVLVLKLHGSCNFLPSDLDIDGNIEFEAGITFDTKVKAVSPNEAITFCLSNSGLYPAMCLYMRSKPPQIGYTKIMELQRKWGEVIKIAKQILIIGAKPYLIDSHIWKPLSECNGKVGFRGSRSEFDNWTEHVGFPTNYKYLSNRWENGLKSGVELLAV